ncbi:MAG TPA: SLC13 family permease [Solirubrobacteraceae bacterium]|nr:SLC13 family permease [Solirubrobacteraceae bacterium]
MNEAIALVALAVSLTAAVARWRWAPDWAVATAAAVLVVVIGALSFYEARTALGRLGPTVGFLAALLILADGCRRAGVFDALGALMAFGSRRRAGGPRFLLAMVFFAAAVTTAVLSLDATIVLLTPIVFATAARLPTSPRPHVYACSHLANSASLLLPVSNLTNLLAFTACGVSFTRFAALMALPWLVAIAVEWVVLSRVFADDLRRASASAASAEDAEHRPELPRFALGVIGLTLLGFGISSIVGVAPVWFATAGAVALTVRRPPDSLTGLVSAAEPTFLVFVLALGVVVTAAGNHGLSSVVDSLLPHGASLPALLAVAGVSAVLANLVNNLPATLIIVAVVSASAPGSVLAMLIGVNVGPNLTYVGSLATLLWRRIVHAHDEDVDTREFLKLGALSVPVSLVACTAALWLALQVF